MHIHCKFCKFKNPNCFSIRQVQSDISVCQGVFPLEFHEYCGYALKKKSIYTDYWELFSKPCWTSITSDAFNHVLFQLPGSRRLLTSPQRALGFCFLHFLSSKFSFLSHPPLPSPHSSYHKTCALFPFPAFLPHAPAVCRAGGNAWELRGDRTSSLSPSWPEKAWVSSHSPRQEEAVCVSCYQLNAISERVHEHVPRQSQCNHALMPTEAYLTFLSQIS